MTKGITMTAMPRPVALAAAVFLTMGTASLAAPTAFASTPTCMGKAATIVSNDRLIVGTSGRDVIIVNGAGAHEVRARGGNDLVCGSGGDDTIVGGAGSDDVNAGGGDDEVLGGDGSDG